MEETRRRAPQLFQEESAQFKRINMTTQRNWEVVRRLNVIACGGVVVDRGILSWQDHTIMSATLRKR